MGKVVELELEPSDFWNLCKHGIGLSVLMFLLVIGWAVFLVFLLAIGSLLGLFIGLGVYALALGYINSFLADLIWDLNTDSGLVSRFFHGVLLFILLLIVEIPMLAINYLFPHWLIMVILFLIYVPIHGFVGVKVAEVFETSSVEQVEGEFWEY
ncbi:MAG TPA: hypothetical protein PKJ15_04855 [Methanomassiliicoccales archaeon]|nr:hypothetical protein [Methanomassiliicoccales archaeon]